VIKGDLEIFVVIENVYSKVKALVFRQTFDKFFWLQNGSLLVT